MTVHSRVIVHTVAPAIGSFIFMIQWIHSALNYSCKCTSAMPTARRSLNRLAEEFVFLGD